MLRIGMFIIFIAVLVMVSSADQSVESFVGDAERGAEIFRLGTNGAPACAGCHLTRPMLSRVMVAPNLSGFAKRAAGRVEGLSAHDYAFASITDPSGFVVDGFKDLMYSRYAERLSAQDIADLIAFLITL